MERPRLPPSDNAEPLLAAVLAQIGQLELLCNEMELALRDTDFERLDRAIADARRTMHAFENAMDASQSVREQAFDDHVHARLRKIYEVRDGQQLRLAAHRDALGERLSGIARWKAYARSIGGSKANRLRRSLLDDRR